MTYYEVFRNATDPRKQNHLASCVSWAEQYLKLDFQCVLFIVIFRTSLDAPDSWWTRCCLKENTEPLRLKQHGGGRVMFWVLAIGNELFIPWRVADGMKMNSHGYIAFQRSNKPLDIVQERQPMAFVRKLVFMRGNLAACTAMSNIEYFLGFKFGVLKKLDRPIVWSSSSQNRIEKIFGTWRLYETGRRFPPRNET